MFYRTLIATIATLLAGSVCRGQGYTVSTIAGGGTNRGTDGLGDGGPAANASLSGNGYGLAVDASGNLYISDTGDNLIRKITSDGTISVVAGDVKGNGGGYYGDGGPAIGAGLNSPGGIAVDSSGDLYIADFGNARVRKVSTSGTISTVAGGGTNVTLSAQATQVLLRLGNAIAVDSAGDIFLQYVTGSGASDQVLKVTPDGMIHQFAGDPSAAFGSLGDGGLATKAFILLSGLALDSSGNLCIADRGDNLIRKVDTSGTITSIAGNHTANYSGDGGQATKAGINMPSAIAVDGSGNVYIDDFDDYRIRKITPDGIINTIAGTGAPGSSGDGGPATGAQINFSLTLTRGNDGSVYFTDSRASDGAGVVRLLTYNAPKPAITSGGVVPVFSSATTVQSGEWVSIYGSNLASTTAIWKGDFPTSLGGTSVTIDGSRRTSGTSVRDRSTFKCPTTPPSAA